MAELEKSSMERTPRPGPTDRMDPNTRSRYQDDETGVPPVEGSRVPYLGSLKQNGNKTGEKPPTPPSNIFFTKPETMEERKVAEKRNKKVTAKELGARPQNEQDIAGASVGQVLDADARNEFEENAKSPNEDFLAPSTLEFVAANTEPAKKKERGKKGGGVVLMPREKKIQLVQDYLDGMNVVELMEKYGISKSYVYGILDDEEMRKVRKAAIDGQTGHIVSAFNKKGEVVAKIIETYLDEALDPARINATSLPSLYTVMGILIDKQVKLEELMLKKREMELKREEMEVANKNNEGLLGEFAEMLKSANTLSKRDQDIVGNLSDEETPYEPES